MAHMARLFTNKKVIVSRPGFLRICSWVTQERREASKIKTVWKVVWIKEADAVRSTSIVFFSSVKWPAIMVNVLYMRIPVWAPTRRMLSSSRFRLPLNFSWRTYVKYSSNRIKWVFVCMQGRVYVFECWWRI